MNDFIASKCFMAPYTAKICPELQSGKIFNAELLCEDENVIFIVGIKNSKKLKIVYEIFV
jgi:hypothetical protein